MKTLVSISTQTSVIKKSIYILGTTLWLLPLMNGICFAQPLPDHFFGTFQFGAYSYIPDDHEIDPRTSITTRMRFGWKSPESTDWSFFTNARVRSELVEEGDGVDRISLWDLRADYGLETKPLAASLGICTMTEISGMGSIAGGQLQTNLPIGLSIGLFGGNNAVISKGKTDTDGIRWGGYLKLQKETSNNIGIGFVSVSDTEYDYDSKDCLVFDAVYRYTNQLFFYQSGEAILSSEQGKDSSGISFYYGNLGYDPIPLIGLSVSYNYFKQLPYIPFLDMNERQEEGSSDFYRPDDSGQNLKTNAVSPRIDLRLTKNWRVYTRYRTRDSDFEDAAASNEWLGGLSCGSLFGSETSFHCNISRFENDDRQYTGSYVSMARNFGQSLNVSLAYAQSRTVYPENQLVAHHFESTQRISASIFYMFTRKLTALIDYERSMGDKEDRDNQVLLNIRYRL